MSETRYQMLKVGEFTSLTICKDGVGFNIDADPLFLLVRNYVRGVPTLHSENARLTAESERLREALEKCAAVLAGDDMTKLSLIEALSAARAALTVKP